MSMGNNFEKVNKFDLLSIESFGYSEDFLNELVPSNRMEDLEVFIERCRSNNVKTYTEKYANIPEMIEKSDKNKVYILDNLVKEIIEAAKRNEIDVVKSKLSEIYKTSNRNIIF